MRQCARSCQHLHGFVVNQQTRAGLRPALGQTSLRRRSASLMGAPRLPGDLRPRPPKAAKLPGTNFWYLMGLNRTPEHVQPQSGLSVPARLEPGVTAESQGRKTQRKIPPGLGPNGVVQKQRETLCRGFMVELGGFEPPSASHLRADLHV